MLGRGRMRIDMAFLGVASVRRARETLTMVPFLDPLDGALLRGCGACVERRRASRKAKRHSPRQHHSYARVVKTAVCHVGQNGLLASPDQPSNASSREMAADPRAVGH